MRREQHPSNDRADAGNARGDEAADAQPVRERMRCGSVDCGRQARVAGGSEMGGDPERRAD
jgi:hypothetical protein